MTKEYMEWVKWSGKQALTKTQAYFAEWLLQQDNIQQIGNLDEIFKSVYKYQKYS